MCIRRYTRRIWASSGYLQVKEVKQRCRNQGEGAGVKLWVLEVQVVKQWVSGGAGGKLWISGGEGSKCLLPAPPDTYCFTSSISSRCPLLASYTSRFPLCTSLAPTGTNLASCTLALPEIPSPCLLHFQIPYIRYTFLASCTSQVPTAYLLHIQLPLLYLRFPFFASFTSR